MSSNNKKILRKKAGAGGTGEGLWRCLNRESEKESYTNIEKLSG